MRRRRLIVGLGLGAGVVLALAWLASPLLAVNALIDAGRRGDADRLERMVDWPALRDSLKDELNEEMRTRLAERLEREDSALSSLGMIFAPALVSGAVDSLVNARTVAAMVRTAEAPSPDRPQGAPANEDDGQDIRQSYAYRGLDTFVVTLTDPERPDRPLDLLLRRDGLFGWKLSGVELPDRS